MGVSNGQPGNATTFNTAFVDKSSDETVAGAKTFSGSMVLSKAPSMTRGDVASSASIASFDSTQGFKKVTGSTATAVHGIVAGSDGQIIFIYNGCSADVTLKHQSGSAGSAVQRMILPDSTDLIISPSNGAILEYDANQSRWVIVSSGAGGDAGYTITGSRASPQQISAASGIAFTGSRKNNLWFISGNSSDTDNDIVSNPQIAAGTIVGQKLTLIGRSSTMRVYLEDGNGLDMPAGPIMMGAGSVIEFFWDGTNWLEIGRNQ